MVDSITATSRHQLADMIATEQPIIEVEITLPFVAVRHMHVQQTVWLASFDNHITRLSLHGTRSAMIHTFGLVLLNGVSIRSRARTLSEPSLRDKFTYIEGHTTQ